MKELKADQQIQLEAEIHRRGQQLQEANERLRESLQQKELLLKEIHHRVKNNLEVINSLISLQADRITDRTARELFEDTTNRVRAIADIHRLLYGSHDLSHVDVAQFLEGLSHSLFSFYGVSIERIRLVVEIHELDVDIQQAVPIALILNELLSNALKHAFPDGRPGSIHISLRSDGNQGLLSIVDNGIGVGQGTQNPSTALGLQLVRVLVEQLRGQLESEFGGGTQHRITFPVDRPERSWERL